MMSPSHHFEAFIPKCRTSQRCVPQYVMEGGLVAGRPSTNNVHAQPIVTANTRLGGWTRDAFHKTRGTITNYMIWYLGSFSLDSVRCLIARAKTWPPGYCNDGSGQKGVQKRQNISVFEQCGSRPHSVSCNTSGQKVEGLPTRYRFRQNTESLAHVIRGQCRRMARAFLSARL